MIRDILRFNKTVSADAGHLDAGETLGAYLTERGYSREFIDHYLVPMTAAIWSAEPVAVLDMPVSFLVRFFANHGLLQLKDRPLWRVVKGGSREYVKRLVAGHRQRIRLHSPVLGIRRLGEQVEVHSQAGGRENFDAVVLACHSDQALAMLKDPTPQEQEVLGAIRYQPNEAVLHTDQTLMPSRRRAWAAWNYHLSADASRQVAVTYNMNILQRLQAEKQYCVTLNPDNNISADRIIKRIQYEHPVYSPQAVIAQGRQAELNNHRTFYCGAYWRNGFHEDGVVSTLNAVRHFEQGLEHGQLHLRRAS
jgi:predicted NAD/FAD-binding protein